MQCSYAVGASSAVALPVVAYVVVGPRIVRLLGQVSGMHPSPA